MLSFSLLSPCFLLSFSPLSIFFSLLFSQNKNSLASFKLSLLLPPLIFRGNRIRNRFFVFSLSPCFLSRSPQPLPSLQSPPMKPPPPTIESSPRRGSLSLSLSLSRAPLLLRASPAVLSASSRAGRLSFFLLQWSFASLNTRTCEMTEKKELSAVSSPRTRLCLY